MQTHALRVGYFARRTAQGTLTVIPLRAVVPRGERSPPLDTLCVPSQTLVRGHGASPTGDTSVSRTQNRRTTS